MPLTDISLSILLGRIGPSTSLVTRLVTILARPVSWWDIGAALPRGILWQGNFIPLAETSFSLILILRGRYRILALGGRYWVLDTTGALD